MKKSSSAGCGPLTPVLDRLRTVVQVPPPRVGGPDEHVPSYDDGRKGATGHSRHQVDGPDGGLRLDPFHAFSKSYRPPTWPLTTSGLLVVKLARDAFLVPRVRAQRLQLSTRHRSPVHRPEERSYLPSLQAFEFRLAATLGAAAGCKPSASAPSQHACSKSPAR